MHHHPPPVSEYNVSYMLSLFYDRISFIRFKCVNCNSYNLLAHVAISYNLLKNIQDELEDVHTMKVLSHIQIILD